MFERVKTMENKELLTDYNEKFKERYLAKSRKIASKYFQELLLLPDKPKELDYFINILKKIYIDNELVRYSENEKFVSVFCSMFPLEIIRAAGARPISLCSTNFIGTYGADTLPTSTCPLVRSISENLVNGLNSILLESEMFIMPLSCDCKKKLANQLSKYKTTFGVEIPFNRFDDNGMNLYVKQIKNIANEISKISGVKITRKSLAKEIRLYCETQNEIKKFNELRLDESVLLRGSYALIVMNAYQYDEISHWKYHLEKLNQELLERKRNKEFLLKKKMPRILLIGSPNFFPNIKVPLIIEEEGALIVSNQFCYGDKPHDDSVSVSNDNLTGYYRALSNRSIKPSSCYLFINNDISKNKIKEIIKTKNIDGVIYVSYQGCISCVVEYQLIRKVLLENNIPSLNIETDLSSEDTELLKIRIAAFIEMLNFKKK